MRSTPTSRLSMFSPFGEMSPTQTHENPLDNAVYAGLRMPSGYAIRIHAEHKQGLTQRVGRRVGEDVVDQQGPRRRTEMIVRVRSASPNQECGAAAPRWWPLVSLFARAPVS